jgi:hypothetical protein
MDGREKNKKLGSAHIFVQSACYYGGFNVPQGWLAYLKMYFKSKVDRFHEGPQSYRR